MAVIFPSAAGGAGSFAGCPSFPPSALFILITRTRHEAHSILRRALISSATSGSVPGVLAACYCFRHCDADSNFDPSSDSKKDVGSECPEETAGHIAAQPILPREQNQQLPPASFRFRLFGGLLAVLAMRLTSGQLARKVACRMGQAVVSRVASTLLADTGEGLHYAGLQCRAACDNTRAARCFSRAVWLSHGPSHAELSYMFIGSCSMQKDLHVAFNIAERGAQLGCNDSKAALASCLRFVWRDEERAVQLAKESASTGNAWGCSELGLLLQHGIGVERDVEQAVAYTSRAACLGNAWARHNLGLMYATGCGVERDYSQAERYRTRQPRICWRVS